MNRRTKHRSTTTATYLRYLKPGALAQLRDSKINSRTQIYLSRTLSSSLLLSPSSSFSPSRDVSAQQQEETSTPWFSMRFYGPQCFQRKKLMAAKSICFYNPSSTGVTSDGLEPVIDGFSNGFLVAH